MSPATYGLNGAAGPGAEDQHERESKRRRSAPLPLDLSTALEAAKPERIIDIVPDGDVLLVASSLSGSQQTVGLRCSSFALSMASPVFKATLNTPSASLPPATDSRATSSREPTGKLLPLPGDDGDAVLLTAYIFHFRHDALPAHVSPDTLLRMGLVATKYECVGAVSRATSQWFDRIFASKVPADTLKMIQAAYLLDEAMFFARFTSRCVISTPTNVKLAATPQDGVQRISAALQTRRIEAFAALRIDIDLLVDPCAAALGKAAQHYCDCPPDDEPDPADYPDGPNGEPGRPVSCVVDKECAAIYLGALRDAEIWPATAWGMKTIEGLTEALREFRSPEYDDSDKCVFCVPLTETFAERLAMVRKLQQERLWGMCLDCFKAGGVNVGECRYMHVKAKTSAMMLPA